jgi:hypothetical protein
VRNEWYFETVSLAPNRIKVKPTALLGKNETAENFEKTPSSVLFDLHSNFYGVVIAVLSIGSRHLWNPPTHPGQSTGEGHKGPIFFPPAKVSI